MIPAFALVLLSPAALASEPRPAESAPPVRLWLDADGDGFDDLYTAARGRADVLLRNLGDGRFEDVTEAWGLAGLTSRAARAADLDGDGRADLLLLDGEGRTRLFRGAARGGFLEAGAELGLESVAPLARFETVDFDRDGWLDLSGETREGALVLLRNRAGLGFERVPLALSALVAPSVDAGSAVAILRPADVAPERDARDPLPDRVRGRSASSSSGARIPAASSSASMPQVAPGSTSPAGPGDLAGTLCTSSIEDQSAPGQCLQASSFPTLGLLYPLTQNLFVAPNGNVGIGTIDPLSELSVVGTLDLQGMLRGYDASNTETLRLDPNDSSGGVIRMYNESGVQTVALDSDAAGSGNSRMFLADGSGATRADLSVQSGAGELLLRAVDGSNTLFLDGEGDNAGGLVSVRNDVSETTVNLLGDDGIGDSGRLQLFNRQGANNFAAVDLRALDGNGTGAELLMAANNGAVTIDIDADFGSGPSIRAFEEDGSRMLELQGSNFALFDSAGVATILFNRQTGTKNAVVHTESYGERLMYAVESQEVWFEDLGSARLSGGRAVVRLDPIFLETVTIDEERPLLVFLSARDASSGLWVEKGLDHFVVHELPGGSGEGRFDWRVVAKRRGTEDLRLEPFDSAALAGGAEGGAPAAGSGPGDGE